jgi:hypothetical protein
MRQLCYTSDKIKYFVLQNFETKSCSNEEDLRIIDLDPREDDTLSKNNL